MVVSLITVDLCDLGIRSISSFLKKKNIKTRIISLNSDEEKYSKEIILELKSILKNSKLIGISFRFKSISKAIQLHKELKKTGIPIIAGGSAAISSPDICIKHFDIVCTTEGEEVMLELYNKIMKKESICEVKGIYFKKNNKIIRNKRSYVEEENFDLDYTSHEEYMLIKEKKFLKINKPPLFYDNYGVFVKNSIFIMSVKGCAFNCSYCINSILKKYFPYRKNSIKELVNQIKNIKEKYDNLKYIYLFDDDFFSRPYKEIKLFSELYKKHINLPFWAYCSPKTISEEKMRCMVNAGLANISMGIQSGSDYINKNIYNRFISKKDVLKATRIINKYDKKIKPPIYDIMINSPFDTEETLLETINLVQEIPKPFYLYCFNLIFFPGSKIFEKIKSNTLDKHIDLSYNKLYQEYKFKNQNSYLNLLLFCMEGLSTNREYGLVPSWFLPLLIKNKILSILFKSNIIIIITLNIVKIFRRINQIILTKHKSEIIRQY